MRYAVCAPVIGLLAAAALAQTAPDRPDVNRKVIEGVKPRLAPGLVPGQQLQPLPIPSLRTSFVETAPVRREGANRNVIERAVRSLAARIFPRKGVETPRTAFTLIERPLAGTDFRLRMGKDHAAPPGIR